MRHIKFETGQELSNWNRKRILNLKWIFIKLDFTNEKKINLIISNIFIIKKIEINNSKNGK